MNQSTGKSAGKKRNRGLTAAALLFTAALLCGAAYEGVAPDRSDPIPIVEKRQKTADASAQLPRDEGVRPQDASPLPQPAQTVAPQIQADAASEGDPALEAVVGTPDDIGEDAQIIVPETTLAPIYRVAPIDADTVNFLLICESDAGAEITALISCNRVRHSAALVAFLRDCWVPVEGRGWDRIAAAYAAGGAGMLINTLNDAFGLDVQSYVAIGLDQLASCVDDMNGIGMNLSQQEAAYIEENCPGSSLREGMNILNGRQALAHARNRSVGNGEFDRVLRQRDVLIAMFRQLSAIENPMQKLSAIGQLTRSARTNASADLLRALVGEMTQSADLRLAAGRVPFDGTWEYAVSNGRSVLQIDLKENAQQIRELLYPPPV